MRVEELPEDGTLTEDQSQFILDLAVQMKVLPFEILAAKFEGIGLMIAATRVDLKHNLNRLVNAGSVLKVDGYYIGMQGTRC